MARFAWMAREDELSPAALTLQAQTIPLDDDGSLIWSNFFPREDTDSVKISTITDLDLRPASDRREWNARGRLIDFETPSTQEWEITPVEAYFQIGEREMQALLERTLGNEDLFRQIVRVDIPSRVDELARANLRRIELDAFEAWSLNQITVMNPQTGATSVFALGYDASRYQTAGVAWDNTNAYANFIAWMQDAEDAVGPLAGAMMRRTLIDMIQASAPNPFSPDSTINMTYSQLEQRISDELGSAFSFYRNERSVDQFDDAGLSKTRTKIWPSDVIAAVPSGERVGSTYFAPVARAMEIDQAVPEAGVDIRGQTAYHETSNNGRHLTVEVQVNPLPLPNENLTYVIDVTP